MDVLGMVLDNIQLYESSRQEAKRSQVTPLEILIKKHCKVYPKNLFWYTAQYFIYMLLAY